MTDQSPNDQFHASSFMQGHNAEYLEQLYAKYANDPNAVDEAWQAFFRELGDDEVSVKREAQGPSWMRADWPPQPNDDLTHALDGQWPAEPEKAPKDLAKKIADEASNREIEISEDAIKRAVLDSVRALMIIRAYRIRGHLAADIDPLGMRDTSGHAELDPKSYGFTEADMDRPIFLDNVLGLEVASMRQIIDIVRATYCGTFALQYMHISNPEEAGWLKERIEGYGKEIRFTREGRRAILNKLVEAEGFEKFLHVKYMGTKRFGLDGGEALIPAMEQIIKRGGNLGVEEVVIGMPHRGRLSVLANVMSKPYRAIFNEFQGGSFKPEDVDGSGDVKYHLGASSDREFDGNTVHLSLTANPSHLEAVNPVVLGKARAKGDQLKDPEHHKVIPVLLHGDAAFAGQGVVAECFQLSGIRGHRTGGTIHIVVNNQIGYTTSPKDSRSTPFCTDVAKAIQAPIFHVNGDAPLAAVRMIRLAMDYRTKFHCDVVLDITCYRRHGHNEGDEPSYTQPLLYKAIENHPTVRTSYQDYLIRKGVLSSDEVKGYDEQVQARLKESLDQVRSSEPPAVTVEASRSDEEWQPKVDTASAEQLTKWNTRLLDWPDDFVPHPKVKGVLGRRADMVAGEQPIDFATAEALAFASLVTNGVPIRLAGQDSGRGTFSQRHAALYDAESERRYVPLNHLEDGQAPFVVVDSLLSEEAALGFEYGYSVATPNGLTMWEAQFGDFVNGAQIQIDQFLAAGEAKWNQQSSVVLLLPHGYDGQGPEHSSARLERFLQLCAENNLRVAMPSCAQSYYHLLRTQALDPQKKPLVVMTTKSLLRQKDAGSPLEELSGHAFLPVLDDPVIDDPKKVTRVICCAGKVYYDLVAARGDDRTVAIVRAELLYPWPKSALQALQKRYGKADWIWCQEEPENMGSWQFVRDRFDWAGKAVRKAAASPATGSQKRHKAEQQALVEAALKQ